MLQLPRDATAVRPGRNAGQCRILPRGPRMLQARELNFRPESGRDRARVFTGRSPHLDIVGSAKPFKGFAFFSVIVAAFSSRADNPRYRLRLLAALDDWRKVAHRLDAVARDRRLRGNHDPADSRFSILLDHVHRWPFFC